jgi:ribA/ribD-fused uncharacterized protein
MKEILLSKFTLNENCKQALIKTHPKKIIYNNKKDELFGSKTNILGKILEEIRQEIISGIKTDSIVDIDEEKAVSREENKIEFYDPKDKNYGYLSNFYGKRINDSFKLVIDKKKWPSVEHYFQAQKFKGDSVSEKYAELIREQDTPMKAKVLASQKTDKSFYPWENELIEQYVKPYLEKGVKLRDDWNEVREDVMKRAVLEKFKQNEDLRTKLLSTEDAELIEASPKDSFWGIGKNKKGQNKLGKILQEVRQEIKNV